MDKKAIEEEDAEKAKDLEDEYILGIKHEILTTISKLDKVCFIQAVEKWWGSGMTIYHLMEKFKEELESMCEADTPENDRKIIDFYNWFVEMGWAKLKPKKEVL